MSFINFNNRSDSQGARYTKAVVKEALLKIETKNEKKVDSLLEGLAGKITLNEALELFSQKLLAMSALDAARLKTLREVNESAEETLADDVNGELFTAWFDGTVSVTATTTNKTWDDGVPVLKELARGRSKTINLKIKGEFSVVHDAAHGWFYFTDGNTWYGLHQDDGYTDIIDLPFNTQYSESEAVDVNEARSIKKIQTEFDGVVADMAATVASWKSAEGDSKTQLLDKLKSLTQKRNDLTKELDLAIMGKDRNVELVGALESVVTEAKFVKDFNRDVLNAKTKEEVLELYPNAEFFIGKSDHFFGELDGNLFFKAYYTKAQEEFEIKSVYSEKGSNYVHLYNESVVTDSNEGKAYKTVTDKDGNTFKPGRKYKTQYGIATFIKFSPNDKIIHLKSDEMGAVKTSVDNANKMELIEESVVTEGVMSEIDIIAKEAKNFKEFVKEFKSDDRYKGLDTVGDVKEFEAWLKSIYDAAKEDLDESVVTEGRVKQFEMDLEDMIKEIKRGYGWIDPEYVADTWENSSDSIDFELVKGEIYKRLIAAKLLAYASDENEEEAGTYIKSLKELGVKESVVTEKFNFSKKEVEAAANLIASAISQADMVKAKVHHLEYDKGRGAGFDISIDGEESAGGSYVVKDNGDVVNAAIGNSHPNAVYNTIGNKNIADVFINMEKYESVVNESEAENILNDLLDERGGDMGELHGMEMEDALDTVEAYGHKGSKAKKIAQELYSLCNESTVTEAKTISFAKASMMGSKLLNKISIGTILDTKGGQYEITGFGQQSNAFKEFEATIDGKEVKVKLTVMYGLKLEVTDDVRSARFNKEEEVNSIILESVVTENYEVIYSDGISQMKKFRNERQALDFMNKEIASNKKLRDIAVYKPGMHSTTQTELVVKFWGEGSYLDNVSKRDKDLAAKKLEESVVLCEATVEMDAMDPDNKDFLKLLKKNRVKIISKEMQGPGGGTPVITMQGKRKDLEAVLADGEYGWDDPDLAEYIEESAVTKAPLSWETLIERVNRPINENLRSKVKTYIKRNEDELNALADSDNWDVIYDKMRSEFDIEKGTEEDKDLIDTFKFTF